MQQSKELLQKRAQVIQGIREFFWSKDFLETDTPSLVVSPGMEPHIRPVSTARPGVYLPTSPEFAMKRLLAAGFPRIFQICKSYRDEPKSATHNPEFAMLEWYRANAGYEAIMDDVEALFGFIEKKLDLPHKPWLRLSVEEAFRRFAGVELTELKAPSNEPGAWDDHFFRIMLNDVEPRLKELGQPVILHSYPASQCALANLYQDERGHTWAKRFEVYANGFEIANAFDELTDPAEQRRRFEKDMALRKAIYGDSFPVNPIDEEFLKALGKMPPSAGIALGVDRLVMYFTGAEYIRDVLWLESYWPL